MESMTGYGSHTLEIQEAVISVEAKSVNQKGLQLVFRLPQVLSKVESSVRETARSIFRRGRIDISVSISVREGETGRIRLDLGVSRDYLDAADILASEFGVTGEITTDVLLGFPGVMVQSSPEDVDPALLEKAAMECINGALEALSTSRKAEGTELAVLFDAKLRQISESVDPLMKNQDARTKARFERLQDRVTKLVGDAGIDSDRMMSELAVMADRVDITEEYDRLKAHTSASLNLIEEDPPECGRKLGFIFQEMLRELNTMGTKIDDSEGSMNIIEMKNVLGALREQVANIE